MGLRVYKLETQLDKTQKCSKEQRKIICFYNVTESQSKKKSYIPSYLLHYDSSTSVHSYGDGFQVVMKRVINQSGHMQVFSEEAYV